MKRCEHCGSEVGLEATFCPSCGSAIVNKDMARATRSGTNRRTKWIVVGLLTVTFVLLFSTYLRVLFREYHPVIEQQPEIVVPIQYGLETKTPSKLIEASIKDQWIVIPVQQLRDYKIVRFHDPAGIQAIPILAYLTPEGKIVTAMSLSENCQSKDFYLQGHNIHCANCPSYWNMSSLEAYACCQRFYPDPIPSTLVNDEIRIEASVVRGWQPRS